MATSPEPASAPRLHAWLSVATCHTPNPTADGEQVLFLSDETGLPQVWAVGTNGGTPLRLLPNDERVGALHAAPSGTAAILAVDRRGDEHWQLQYLPDVRQPTKGGRMLTDRPAAIHLPGGWRDDGRRFVFSSNARDGRFFDIHQLNVDRPGELETLWEHDGWTDLVAVREEDLLIAERKTNLDADLYLVRSGARHHLNPHSGEQTVTSGTLAGGIVYVGSNPGREFCALVRYRVGASNHEFLREYDGDVELVRASPDGQFLAVVLNRQGWSDTRVYAIATGEERALNSGQRGVVGSLRWLPDSSGYVFDLSSTEGVDVYRRLLATGKEKRLATSPRLVPVHLAPPRLGEFRASDGVSVPYWEYAPTPPSVRGTILWVHGGPEAQARPSFSPVVEFLVAEGWRVIAPNVRGSTGYGRTFVHLDDVGLRLNSVRDLSELVGRLVRDGKATPGRLGIVGASYGGFMVLSAATRYPELWGAAVDVVGIANLVTFLEETGPWRRALREAEYGSLTTDRRILEDFSPIHRAAEIRAPLFVIHGRNDPRVPVHEAEQIVGTLRTLGREVELLIFEDEGHVISRLPNRILAWSRAVEFLDRHLTPRA
ncbi:MAG: S9 family peptidase [Thermoplasmata archaeon]|nr:S9 family peptidase [Thermoplasmata archaeon]